MNRLGSTGSSVIVGRNVAVVVGVRVGGLGVTPGSSVGGISVGPSVFIANGSRVGVADGNNVTVGAVVFVGAAVAVFRNDKSTSGKAEHPVMMIARRRDTIFFTFMLCMVPQNVCWDYCINCIRFDGIIFPFLFFHKNSPLQTGPLALFANIYLRLPLRLPIGFGVVGDLSHG